MIDLQSKQPLILTYAQLRMAVLPVMQDDAWGNDTLGDLWRMGAPSLDSGPLGTPSEKRIIFPNQLYKWLLDISTRRGRNLDLKPGV